MALVNVKVIPKQALTGSAKPIVVKSPEPCAVEIYAFNKKLCITALGVRVLIAGVATAVAFPEAVLSVVAFAVTKVLFPLGLYEAAITAATNIGLIQLTGHGPTDFVEYLLSPLGRIEDAGVSSISTTSGYDVVDESGALLATVMVLYDPAS